MTTEKTGYPSEDRPWRKNYSEESTYTGPSPDSGMCDFMQMCNVKQLDAYALNFLGKRITYSEMFTSIDCIAGALYDAGVKKGEIVSICGLNTPEFFELIYAVNKIGAASNLIGLTSSIQDLHDQIAVAESRFVFFVDVACEKIIEACKGTCAEVVIRIPLAFSLPKWKQLLIHLKENGPKRNSSKSDVAVCEWDSFIHRGMKRASLPIDRKVSGDDLAAIVYTGGSTGIPKGVMLSNRALNAYYVNFFSAKAMGYLSYQSRDTFLSCVPIFLAFGISSAGHGPLCNSMELVLAPDPKPNAVATVIRKTHTNHVLGGRLHVDALVRMGKRTKSNLSYIHSVMYGGEGADHNWEKQTERGLYKNKMTSPVLNGYGMSETAAAILFTLDEPERRMIPFSNVDLKILDPEESHTECGFEEEGELCISSDTVMMGYFKNDDETRNVIFVDNGKRWIRTHDLAVIHKDGSVTITGRIKRIYHKLGPDNVEARVYPMRIEECIEKDPDVEKCAVLGIKDDRTAYRTIAYVIPKARAENQSVLKEQLSERCRSMLPGNHVPDEYVFINEFPLTRAGKVDYLTLEKMLVEV